MTRVSIREKAELTLKIHSHLNLVRNVSLNSCIPNHAYLCTLDVVAIKAGNYCSETDRSSDIISVPLGIIHSLNVSLLIPVTEPKLRFPAGGLLLGVLGHCPGFSIHWVAAYTCGSSAVTPRLCSVCVITQCHQGEPNFAWSLQG